MFANLKAGSQALPRLKDKTISIPDLKKGASPFTYRAATINKSNIRRLNACVHCESHRYTIFGVVGMQLKTRWDVRG